MTRADPTTGPGAKLDAPAFHRNHAPITAELERLLADATGSVLEIGSGTGQHVAKFAAALPHLTWWPTEPDPTRRASIAAYRDTANLANLRAPTALDVLDPWSLGQPDHPPTPLAAILAINVIHIAPWAVAEHLVANAARHLDTQGLLILYGPFKRDGHHTADSNAAFDHHLRSQNPDWGVRDLADLATLAGPRFALLPPAPMPANNFTVALQKQPQP